MIFLSGNGRIFFFQYGFEPETQPVSLLALDSGKAEFRLFQLVSQAEDWRANVLRVLLQKQTSQGYRETLFLFNWWQIENV